MTKSFPYLAMDSAGKRTILCDYPIKMFDNTTKKETTKMTLSSDQLSHYIKLRIQNPAAADRYWNKCKGRNIAADAALDDESIAALKDFLQSKLRPEDHKAACALMDGASNGEPDEAQDDDLPENVAGRPLPKKASALAGDSAGFAARFPGLSHVRLDNSGIAIPKRAASGGDAADFNARFPGLAGIKLR